MNLGLAFLAFLMIVLGSATGFYPVAILGVFVLIASLLAPSRPPRPRRSPIPEERSEAPSRTAPARISPPIPKAQAKPQAAPAAAPETMSAPTRNQGYASNMALFPATMFPSVSLSSAPQQPQAQLGPTAAESKDELVELAALAVFLRLLSG